MKVSDIAHLSGVGSVPDKMLDFFFEEWAAHGLNSLIFESGLVPRCLEDAEFRKNLLAKAKNHGCRFTSGHTPWGREWDLNLPSDRRAKMLDLQTRSLELAAEAGCVVHVFHIGDSNCYDGTLNLAEARDNLDFALDKLIPVAERLNVTLCIENCEAPTDSAAENLRALEKFHSPCFGFCYDSGHANIMQAKPGKRKEDIVDWIQHGIWKGKMEFYPRNVLDEILPHLVTCHLNDNNGLADQHVLPLRGNVPWGEIMPKILNAPRLKTVQNEVSVFSAKFSVPGVIEAFRKIGFE